MQMIKPLQGRPAMVLSLMVASAFAPVALAEHESSQSPQQQPFQPASTIAEGIRSTHYHKIRKLTGFIHKKYGVPQQKATAIVTEALNHGAAFDVEPELILAVIAVESTFNERAVSPRGARGLMQVMPNQHTRRVREVGGTQALFDPQKNIYTGTGILSTYMDMSRDNLRKALLLYNGSYGGPKSGFADKVLRVYTALKSANVSTEMAYVPSSEYSRDGPLF